MTSLRRPRPLPPGGTIGILSPSSPADPALLQAGIAVLEARGFAVRLAPHALDNHGHRAGADADRAADFVSLYADPAVHVLWCARGGASSCRLWPLLDWAELAALPPKMLVGYSDITSLHVPLTQTVGTASLHGPMVSELSHTPGAVLDWLLRLLHSPYPAGDVPGRAPDTLVPGTATGPLVGGCLSLLAATLGTPYQINTQDALLLIEDTDEAPHRIERYLMQLAEAGVLASAAGFLVGEATNADVQGTLPMRFLWEEALIPYGKPATLGFPFGHVSPNYALPLGVRARLHADTGTLTLLEPAVDDPSAAPPPLA